MTPVPPHGCPLDDGMSTGVRLMLNPSTAERMRWLASTRRTRAGDDVGMTRRLRRHIKVRGVPGGFVDFVLKLLRFCRLTSRTAWQSFNPESSIGWITEAVSFV